MYKMILFTKMRQTKLSLILLYNTESMEFLLLNQLIIK